MMIYTTNQINPQQLQDLEELAALCQKKDNGLPCLYTHILTQHRAFPASLLYYDNKKLVGFLSAFFFFDTAVEVSLLVHPSYRKKGIAKELLRHILPLVQFQNFFTLIFSSPTHMNHQWLKAKGYTYKNSEYYMARHELNPILEYQQPLVFKAATNTDIPTLNAIDEACFPKKQSNAVDRMQQILNSRDYDLILALYEGKPIGKVHVRWQKKGATLSDIAILPEYQGQGLGSTLIAHCVNWALSEGKTQVNLDVETHNSRALNLYIRLGFLTQNSCDFWSIDIEQLNLA